MRNRAVATVVTALLSLAVWSTATTSSAAPPAAVTGATVDDGCVASLHLPERLVVRNAGNDISAYLNAAVGYSAECTEWDRYNQLSWAADGPDGTRANVSVATERCGSPLLAENFLFLGVPPALGKLTFTGHGTSQCDNHTITEAPQTIDARVASSTSTTASRSGGVVTITAHASRLWTSTNTFGVYAGATGTILASSDGVTWKPLKNLRTGSRGTYTYSYHTAAHLRYRTLVPDAQWVWGHLSAATAPI